MLKIHALLHVPFETPGYIDTWIKTRKHELTTTKFFSGDALPIISDFDWLLVMGGPMSVNDENEYPWLKAEKHLIKEAIDKGKPVIGICLGAQLIANVLGSKIYPNEKKEIGWFPVKTTIHSTDHELFSSLPRAVNVFHWHGETFDLPEGALLLAESSACKNQLFVYNEKVIGFQFHLEVTEELLNSMVEAGKDELKKEEFVQGKDEILDNTEYINQCNVLLDSFLNNLEDLTMERR